MEFSEMWAIFGPGLAGAVFGAGWWIWVDAVVCSSVKVSFLHYLPGIFASFAALMFNCVSRDELQDLHPYDYDDGCRAHNCDDGLQGHCIVVEMELRSKQRKGFIVEDHA